MMPKYPGTTLRPYQVLCAVCALGGDDSSSGAPKTRKILETIRKTPDLPITLRCNAGDVFTYQDAGTAEDTPGGADYNVKRDLEILYQLNLNPGCTLPARIIFHRVLERIAEVSGICGFGPATSQAWKGCPQAQSGNYQRGRAKGIDAIIPPRSADEMKQEKKKSLEAMNQAEAIAVRPHLLMCALCQYGGGTRPPYPEDNLPELLALIRQKPDTLLRMVPYADWMMCAPCPMRAPALNACVNNKGSGGLPNLVRDLRVLQKLGLTYGAKLKAGDLYQLIFQRISGTLEICRFEHAAPSVWCCGCGAAATNSANYEQGRKLLRAEWGMPPQA